ncbi:MAG: hypothetical protein M3N52_11885 [Actinomycetota bacterium]|nr:hypothetical protein [Actinomycetota bacterium]
MTSERSTAGLRVEIYPSGAPSLIKILVRNLGPEFLTRTEAVRALRAAADTLEWADAPLAPDWDAGSEVVE